MAALPIEAYRDPYRRCERDCNHDLAQAVTISELLSEDGPHPDVSPLLAPMRGRRAPALAPGLVAASR
ncbi:MAG TPA: hypothetical protein VGC11_01020 [Acidimicrobiia bacterium]|jgi:hypothetical protein